jgi:hypothetical protein
VCSLHHAASATCVRTFSATGRVNTGVLGDPAGIVEDNTMRYHEIARRPAAPETHPYVVDIAIDPADFRKFERLMQDRPEVRLLCRVDGPRSWTVHVACASAAVRKRLQDTWG